MSLATTTESKLSRLGRSALAYAERFGWAVHPLRPGAKTPLTAHGFKNASRDAEQIRAWWAQTPDANVGIATGQASGISVLDVDVKDGAAGDVSLRALLERYGGDLTEHVCQRTWSGGLQYVFAYDSRAKQGAGCYGPNLDGRNDGGYIVAPPSVVQGKTYEWIVKPGSLLAIPEWLHQAAEALRPTPQTGERKNPVGWADELMLAGADKGSRDHEAWRLVNFAHETGKSEAECLAMLKLFGERCRPPFDATADRNILGKIKRAYAKAPIFGGSEPAVGEEIKPKVRFRRGKELDDTPLGYLVEPMIPAGMLSALGGKDGMGKTLFGMEVIKAILTGEPLFGQFQTRQGPVCALFLDDPEFLVRERLLQLGILDHPDLYVATENDVDMSDPKAMLEGLTTAIRALDPKPIFIFVDALYLFIPGGGQTDQGNSAGAMKPVIMAFNQVANDTGAAVQIVAHDNKAGSDLAGSYAIRAGLKGILRFLRPPDVAQRIAKGDEEAAESPERLLQLNKLKTGKPTSWYMRLDGPGQWTFHGGSREYRKATLGARILAYLEDHGECTEVEIRKGVRSRDYDVQRECARLHLRGLITKRERPSEDGKGGRPATVYGPVFEESDPSRSKTQNALEGAGVKPPVHPNGMKTQNDKIDSNNGEIESKKEEFYFTSSHWAENEAFASVRGFHPVEGDEGFSSGSSELAREQIPGALELKGEAYWRALEGGS